MLMTLPTRLWPNSMARNKVARTTKAIQGQRAIPNRDFAVDGFTRMSKHLAAVPNRDLVSAGLVGIREACEFLGIKKSALYELMQTELSWTRIGSQRKIPKNALVEYAAKGLVRRYPEAS